MTVDRASALRVTRDGRIHYFCFDHCRRVFEEAYATIVSGRGS